MKTLVAFFAFAMMTSAVTQAQDNRSVKEEAKFHTDRLARALDLNEDQKKKVYSQYEITEQKIRDARSKETTAQEKENIAKRYMQDREQAFKRILTEEQYTKYLTIKDHHKDGVEHNVKDKERNRSND